MLAEQIWQIEDIIALGIPQSSSNEGDCLNSGKNFPEAIRVAFAATLPVLAANSQRKRNAEPSTYATKKKQLIYTLHTRRAHKRAGRHLAARRRPATAAAMLHNP
jgi:hypothetical protein